MGEPGRPPTLLSTRSTWRPPAAAWFGEDVSMRWVMIHMLEELARHAGHMDVMRELIDGMTGDHDRS